MSPQYQILSELLIVLRNSPFCSGRLNSVECLIYRLKLTLLTFERYGSLEQATLCPAGSLREMQRMIMVVDSIEAANAALRWIEEELSRLIQSMELIRPDLATDCVQEESTFARHSVMQSSRV